MSDIAVIATYYNFTGFEKPRENLHRFSKNMNNYDVDLFYAEAYLEGTTPELPIGPNVFQYPTNAVLWYKENLINVVVKNLPPKYKYICYVDGDTLFNDDNLEQKIREQLEQFPIAQGFSKCLRLDRNGYPDEVFSSFPYWFKEKEFGMHARPVQGGVWVANRKFFEEHGLYDKLLMGGGDCFCVCAYYGWWDDELTNRFPAKLLEDYHEWAYPVHDSILGRVGCVDTVPSFQWHGKKEGRLYGSRHLLLHVANYDPKKDLCYDDNGLLRWNSNNKALHDACKYYFLNRQEDG